MNSVGGTRLTDFDRRPVLYFHTSNADKWLQARILATEAGLILTQFLAQAEPYEEDYTLPPHEMLAASLAQGIRRAGRGGLVFVEDTTVRVEALSSDGESVPGLRTKEWFAETNFSDFSDVLQRAGDRRVTVRSDIALHVPGLVRPVRFHGETRGVVVDEPPPAHTHEVYRWLTTQSFNGWFVPDGANKTLGEMQFEESRRFDFRDKALTALFERMVEYSAALNLPPSAYRRRRPMPTSTPADISAPKLQLEFPDSPRSETANIPQFLVIGRTCAGKTTFATHALSTFGIRYIEASDALMRIQHTSRGLPDPNTDKSGYAFALLERTRMDQVVRQIFLEEGDSLLRTPFVVSGLRTIEEIATFRRRIPGVKMIFIDAPLNMRFERYTLRNRADDPGGITRDRFQERDQGQDRFGLLPVARDVADFVIENRGSLHEYVLRVESLLHQAFQVQASPTARAPETTRANSEELSRTEGRRTRLARALMRVRDEGPLTLKEIERLEGLGEHNASRVLGFAPNTTQRAPGPDGRELWTITNAGLDYLSILAGADSNFEELDIGDDSADQ